MITEHRFLLRPDPQDWRDWRMTAEPEVEIPPMVSLLDKCPPIFNQGRLGSCTANAGVAAYMMLHELTSARHDFSRLFLYYAERVLEGNIAEDAGATMRTIGKALNKSGVCLEEFWPYDVEQFASEPSLSAFEDAQLHTITSYTRLTSLDGIKQYIATKRQPVMIGMWCYSSMMSKRVDDTGILPMPRCWEKRLGGHAVLVVGYDDATKLLTVRNSWGAAWGDRGYFYMPYRYVTSGKAFDFWTIA